PGAGTPPAAGAPATTGRPGAVATGTPVLVFEELRLRQPGVTFRERIASHDNASGLDFFVEILEPRVEVRRLEVERGSVGALAPRERAPVHAAEDLPSERAVDRWLWRMRDIDLVAVDIRIGGRDAGLAER